MMKLILLILGLMLLTGTASATDYYVAPTGNDGNGGQSIGDAWLTIPKAASTVTAGDIAYIINGTYTLSGAISFSNSGNSTHPIKMIAYNGTPYITGDISSALQYNGKSYINVSGLEFYSNVRKVAITGSHNTLHNCTVGGSTSDSTIRVSDNASYIYIINNVFHNQSGGSNLMNLVARYNQNLFLHDIVITGNTFKDISDHNVLNFYDNDNSVNVRGHWNFTVSNNTIYNATNNCIVFGTNWVQVYDSTFNDNLIHDVNTGISIYANDSVFERNTVYNVTFGVTLGTNDRSIYNSIYTENNATILNLKGENITVVNNLGTTVEMKGGSSAYMYMKDWYGTQYLQLKYTSRSNNIQEDNQIFTTTKTGGAGSYDMSEVLYYPTNSSNYINMTTEQVTYFTLIQYNISARPTTDYLKDVVLNTYNLGTDTYNVTINSSVAENPTWINVTVVNASNTYNISRDGVYYDSVVSDSNSIARYHYSVVGNEWSEHSFEFTWANTTGWSPTANTTYKNVPETWYENGTRAWLTTQPQASDTIITGWTVVVT